MEITQKHFEETLDKFFVEFDEKCCKRFERLNSLDKFDFPSELNDLTSDYYRIYHSLSGIRSLYFCLSDQYKIICVVIDNLMMLLGHYIDRLILMSSENRLRLSEKVEFDSFAQPSEIILTEPVSTELFQYSYFNKAYYHMLFLQKESGVVVFFNGDVQSWVSELCEPSAWCPGCIAVDGDRLYITVGGNQKDGSDTWQLLGSI